MAYSLWCTPLGPFGAITRPNSRRLTSFCRSSEPQCVAPSPLLPALARALVHCPRSVVACSRIGARAVTSGSGSSVRQGWRLLRQRLRGRGNTAAARWCPLSCATCHGAKKDAWISLWRPLKLSHSSSSSSSSSSNPCSSSSQTRPQKRLGAMDDVGQEQRKCSRSAGLLDTGEGGSGCGVYLGPMVLANDRTRPVPRIS